jgi:ribonuclease VapC
LIVVDSSALVAIAQREPEREAALAALDRADVSYISPINYVETGVVVIARGLLLDRAEVDDWLAGMGVEVREDLELGHHALEAYLRFGKGLDPAGLNLADCFAYALAKQLDLPLLYKGDDFAKTDVRSVL